MKSTAIAAFAALVAVAPTAFAEPPGSSPGDQEAVRAAAEARALVSTMQTDTRVARDALELARKRQRREEIRCADEALSRADGALRWGRDDASHLADALAAHDTPVATLSLQRLRFRGADAHDAARMARQCSVPERDALLDRTSVTVVVDRVPPLGAVTFGDR